MKHATPTTKKLPLNRIVRDITQDYINRFDGMTHIGLTKKPLPNPEYRKKTTDNLTNHWFTLILE